MNLHRLVLCNAHKWMARFTPASFNFDRNMSFALLLISLFISNGITVNDLGLILAVVAVVILFMGVIHRAAVGPFVQGHPVL
jgi:hypothetical protein